jgi:hypothetical protein
MFWLEFVKPRYISWSWLGVWFWCETVEKRKTKRHHLHGMRLEDPLSVTCHRIGSE